MNQAIKQGGWTLVENGIPVLEGDVVTDFRGDTDIVRGGRPPHKPSSSGFVWTASGREFYPDVFGLKWVKAE
jgi:hypothetical protein